MDVKNYYATGAGTSMIGETAVPLFWILQNGAVTSAAGEHEWFVT